MNDHAATPRETLTSNSYQKGVSSGLPQDSTDAANVRHRVREEHQVHLARELQVVFFEILEQDLSQLDAVFHGLVRLCVEFDTPPPPRQKQNKTNKNPPQRFKTSFSRVRKRYPSNARSETPHGIMPQGSW